MTTQTTTKMNVYGFTKTTARKIMDLNTEAIRLLDACKRGLEHADHNLAVLKKASYSVLNTEMFIDKANLTHMYIRDRGVLIDTMNTVVQVMMRADILSPKGFYDLNTKLAAYLRLLAGKLAVAPNAETYKVLVEIDRSNNETKPVGNIQPSTADEMEMLTDRIATKNLNDARVLATPAEFLKSCSDVGINLAVLEVAVVSRKNLLLKDGKKVIRKRSTNPRLKVGRQS
jgi:hypothetical protein